MRRKDGNTHCSDATPNSASKRKCHEEKEEKDYVDVDLAFDSCTFDRRGSALDVSEGFLPVNLRTHVAFLISFVSCPV